jgi:hypothetical protein
VGKKDYLKLGSWNVICDRCGAKAKSEDLVKEWTGLMVHPACHEPRNQQDFLTGVPDSLPKPYYRPVAVETFVDTSTTPDSHLLIP